jgi:hypothetical protein
MQELEILDLGDVMVETRCSAVAGAFVDFLYGPHRWHC